MKHLTGKKLQINCNAGKSVIGLCTGGTDDIIKILPENKEDEMVIFIRNIFSYTIIGEGCSGGYSGLKVYMCKCADINCKGRLKLSCNCEDISEMGCEISKSSDKKFKCEFGCLGAMEVIPSNVQKILFDGMIVCKNGDKIK